MVIKLTKENFEQEVLKSDVPVLVDFWASWCAPCKVMGPVLDEFATEVGSVAKIAKVNVDENPDLASKYKIMSIPTLIVFKNGEIKETAIGIKTKEALKQLLGL